MNWQQVGISSNKINRIIKRGLEVHILALRFKSLSRLTLPWWVHLWYVAGNTRVLEAGSVKNVKCQSSRHYGHFRLCEPHWYLKSTCLHIVRADMFCHPARSHAVNVCLWKSHTLHCQYVYFFIFAACVQLTKFPFISCLEGTLGNWWEYLLKFIRA